MIDLVIVGAYFALMLGVGWKARRGSPESYWVAERRYGTFPVTASLVATVFGASSTVGIIGLGYSRGLTGAWWSLIGGIALLPFGFFLAGKVRRLEVYTLPDILHRAYGRKVALVGGGIIVLAWCGVVAAQIVAGALLLGSVFSISFNGTLAVVTVIFVLYTLWGGQLSVIRTDSWQIFLFVGALLTTLFLVLRAGLQGGGLLAGVPAGHFDFPVSAGFRMVSAAGLLSPDRGDALPGGARHLLPDPLRPERGVGPERFPPGGPGRDPDLRPTGHSWPSDPLPLSRSLA